MTLVLRFSPLFGEDVSEKPEKPADGLKTNSSAARPAGPANNEVTAAPPTARSLLHSSSRARLPRRARWRKARGDWGAAPASAPETGMEKSRPSQSLSQSVSQSVSRRPRSVSAAASASTTTTSPPPSCLSVSVARSLLARRWNEGGLVKIQL